MTDYKGNWIDPHDIEREAARLRAKTIADGVAMLRRRIADLFRNGGVPGAAVRATAA